MRIDVHTHLWPRAYMDLLRDLGSHVDFVTDMGAGDSEPELRARFELLDMTGIDRQVLSPAAQVIETDDESAAVEAARSVNDAYAALVHRYPDRFRAFATLPLPHVEASLKELSRALDTLDLVGVAALTSVQGKSVIDSEFEPLWDELDRRGAVLFLHPAGSAAGSPLISDYHVTWLVGAPIEDTLAAMHIIRYAMPLRYPRVKVIISHVGGALPMLLGRLDDQPSPIDKASGPEVREPFSDSARRLWYDVVVHRHPPALRAAVDSLGADRLLLGTDFPFQRGERFVPAVEYVRQAGLDPADVDRILDMNAPPLFGW